MNKLANFDDSDNDDVISDNSTAESDNENENIAVTLNDNENMLLNSSSSVSSSPVRIKELKYLNHSEYISIFNEIYNASKHNKPKGLAVSSFMRNMKNLL